MSFSNQLLFDDIRAAFQDGDISEGLLSNDHPLMEGQTAKLEQFAELIGVDFGATQGTYRLGKSGFINNPEVKAFNSEAVIEWGEQRKPLAQLFEIDNISLSFSFREKTPKEKGNSFYLTVESDELAEDQQPKYSYTFGVACDPLTPRNLISKAFDGFKNGKTEVIRKESGEKFADFLMQRAKSMGALPLGTFTVVWFGAKNDYGYTVKLNTGEKVYSNSKLTGTLNDLEPNEIYDPVTKKFIDNSAKASITVDKPAKLTVTGHGTYENKQTGKTSPTCKFEFQTTDSMARRAKAKAYSVGKATTIDATEYEYPQAEDHSVATLEPEGEGFDPDIPF